MSQRFRLRFAAILSIYLGCDARSGATAPSNDRIVPAGEKTSAAIHDVRPPALAANAEAAMLMQQLRERQADDAATRVRLATLYENANFLTMGEFFRASVAVTNGAAIEWKHHNGWWACGGDAAAEFAAVNSWQKQLLRGEVAAVENDSAAAVQAKPTSCLIQLTHAEATLIHSTMDRAAVDNSRQELAMRTWLTLSDEGNILPAGKTDIVAVTSLPAKRSVPRAISFQHSPHIVSLAFGSMSPPVHRKLCAGLMSALRGFRTNPLSRNDRTSDASGRPSVALGVTRPLHYEFSAPH